MPRRSLLSKKLLFLPEAIAAVCMLAFAIGVYLVGKETIREFQQFTAGLAAIAAAFVAYSGATLQGRLTVRKEERERVKKIQRELFLIGRHFARLEAPLGRIFHLIERGTSTGQVALTELLNEFILIQRLIDKAIAFIDSLDPSEIASYQTMQFSVDELNINIELALLRKEALDSAMLAEWLFEAKSAISLRMTLQNLVDARLAQLGSTHRDGKAVRLQSA